MKKDESLIHECNTKVESFRSDLPIIFSKIATLSYGNLLCDINKQMINK
jgi:hypothetical protein